MSNISQISKTIDTIKKEYYRRIAQADSRIRINVINEANTQFWERMKARDEFRAWKREHGLK